MSITLDNLHSSLKQKVYHIGPIVLLGASASRVICLGDEEGDVKSIDFYCDSISGNPQLRVFGSDGALCASTSMAADTRTEAGSISYEIHKDDAIILAQTQAGAAVEQCVVKIVVERNEDQEDLT